MSGIRIEQAYERREEYNALIIIVYVAVHKVCHAFFDDF